MRRSDQHEHAMDTDVGYEGKSNRSTDQSGVMNGHGKSKNAYPNVPLQDVDNRFEVSGRNLPNVYSQLVNLLRY